MGDKTKDTLCTECVYKIFLKNTHTPILTYRKKNESIKLNIKFKPLEPMTKYHSNNALRKLDFNFIIVDSLSLSVRLFLSLHSPH